MIRREIRHYDNNLHLCRAKNKSFITVETTTTSSTDYVDSMEILSYSIRRKAWLSNTPNNIISFKNHRELISWKQNQLNTICA